MAPQSYDKLYHHEEPDPPACEELEAIELDDLTSMSVVDDFPTPPQTVHSSVTDRPIRLWVAGTFCWIAEAFQLSAPFAFAAFMVADLSGIPSGNVGLFAGLLSASVFAGIIFSSYAWGCLSDRLGLKNCIISCMVITLVLNVAFGFCKNYWVAVGIRFISGLGSGNLAMTKALVGQLTPPPHRNMSMAVLNGAYSLGSILGPVFGGLLARACLQYPGTFGEIALLQEFPYLLPQIASATVIGIAMILVVALMPSKKAADAQMAAMRAHQDAMFNTCKMQEIDSRETALLELEALHAPTSAMMLLHVEEDSGHIEELSTEDSDAQQLLNKAGDNTSDCAQVEPKRASRFASLRSLPLLPAIVYALMSFMYVMIDETLPLYLSAPLDSGGLKMRPQTIGSVYGIIGVGNLFTGLILFTFLERKYTVTTICKMGLVMNIVAIGLLPTLHIAAKEAEGAMWSAVVIISLVYSMGQGLGFTAGMVFVTNAVRNAQMARMNGLTMMLTAVARTVGPLISGMVWNVAQKQMMGKMTGSLLWAVPFLMQGLIAMGVFCAACRLSKTLNYPAPENDEKPPKSASVV